MLLAFVLLVACGESESTSGPLEGASSSSGEGMVQTTLTDGAAPAGAEDGAAREFLEQEDPEPSEDNPFRRVTNRRWTGDLDELTERRAVRVLTVHSPGRFYLEEGRGRYKNRNPFSQNKVKPHISCFCQFTHTIPVILSLA